MTRTQKLFCTAGLVLGMLLTVVGCLVVADAFGPVAALPTFALWTWVGMRGTQAVAETWGYRDVMGSEIEAE